MAAAGSVALTGSDQQAFSGPCVYRGIVARETAASTAVVRVYDGTSTSGVLIGQVTLAANGDSDRWYETGIWCPGGVFVDIVSGAVVGSVRVG